MKKKEILEIIKNKKTIENSILLPISSVCHNNQKLFDKLIDTYDELKQKYQEDIKAKEEYKEFQNSRVCDHPIRQLIFDEEPDIFGIQSFYQCVFCNHQIPTNKTQVEWLESDYYNNCVFIENDYFNTLDFLLEILNSKDNDDEIDFIEELKKLSLDPNMFTINDTKRCENYIMIITSTLDTRDKISQNELIFLNKIFQIKGIKVLLFLNSVSKSNSPLNYLSNDDVYISTDKYALLKLKQNVPIKMIINLAPNLSFQGKGYYNLKLLRDLKTITDYLKKSFSTSQIINLENLNLQTIEEITTYIEQLINDSNQFDNNDNQHVKKLIK